MDAFMNKLERLATLAEARSVPRPLDCGGVMSRIRGLECEREGRVLSLPMGVFAGGAAIAAAAAVVVTALAVSAWSDMGSPLEAMESMFSLMDVI